MHLFPCTGKAARLLGLASPFALALVALVLVLSVPAPARSDVDAKEIARLIEQLGDDELEARKAAEKKLAGIGESALEPLRKAAKSHADPDVRLRAIVLIRAIEKGVFGEMRKFIEHSDTIRHIAVSRDGKRALTGSMDTTVRLWDLDSGKELKTLRGHTSWVWTVAFSPDEKYALSSGSLDKTLRLWDLETGKEVRKFESATVVPAGSTSRVRVYGADFSPDGKYVLSSEADASSVLRLYETATGKEVRTFVGHDKAWVWKAIFSPDGKKIASAGCNDYSYRVWDAASGKSLVVGAKAHNGYVVGIAFAPDGKHLLTSGRDHEIKLWEVDTGKLIRTYDGATDNVEAVAFSKDGRRFLAGEHKLVQLFDTESGKILHRFEDHTDWVFAVAFLDGRRAISGGGRAKPEEPQQPGGNFLRLWGLPR